MSESASDRPPSAAAPPKPDDDTTVEFLTEIIDYFERLRERARLGYEDTAAMQIAKEAIGLCREALDDARKRRASREGGSSPDRNPVDIPTLKQVVVDAHDSAIQDPGCKHCRRTASILTGGALDALDRGRALGRGVVE